MSGRRLTTAAGGVSDHPAGDAAYKGLPLVRIGANNRPFRPAYVRVVYTPPGGGYNTATEYFTTPRQSEVIDKEPEGGPELWIYRGNDIDSGSWYSENTKNIVIALWSLPCRPEIEPVYLG